MLTDKELKLAQSKSFAEYNLSMEPKLREGSSRLETTHNTAIKMKDEVELLKAKLDSIAENRSLDSISAVLQAAAQEAEDQSEVDGIILRYLKLLFRKLLTNSKMV